MKYNSIDTVPNGRIPENVEEKEVNIKRGRDRERESINILLVRIKTGESGNINKITTYHQLKLT